MDAETIQFITAENRELRKELKKDLKEIIEPVMDEVKTIKRETYVARWMQRNPRPSLIIIFIVIAAIAFGSHSLNLRRTVEKVLRIELNE